MQEGSYVWRLKNPQKYKEGYLNYYQKNKDKKRAYYEQNKAKIIARSKARYWAMK